jgi:hypothetical protein
MTPRLVVCAFLLVALAVSGVGWAETPREPRGVDNAVTLTQPVGLTVDATLNGRSDVLTAGWAEQRLPKARIRLGLAVLVGLSVLLLAAIVTLTRPSPAAPSALSRRWSVALRAPPVFRLS